MTKVAIKSTAIARNKVSIVERTAASGGQWEGRRTEPGRTFPRTFLLILFES